MAQDFTKVTINQIDTKAEDVDKVGGIAADHIAVSIDGDRETVPNALKLGGKLAADYMTTTTGNSLNKRTENIKSKFGSDILALRDELYQLRGQLAKNGYVKDFTIVSMIIHKFI